MRLVQVPQIRIGLFETFLRYVCVLGSSENEKLALIDETAAVGDLPWRVTACENLLPLGVSNIVSDSLQIQPPYIVVDTSIKILTTQDVEKLIVRSITHVAAGIG